MACAKLMQRCNYIEADHLVHNSFTSTFLWMQQRVPLLHLPAHAHAGSQREGKRVNPLTLLFLSCSMQDFQSLVIHAESEVKIRLLPNRDSYVKQESFLLDSNPPNDHQFSRSYSRLHEIHLHLSSAFTVEMSNCLVGSSFFQF